MSYYNPATQTIEKTIPNGPYIQVDENICPNGGNCQSSDYSIIDTAQAGEIWEPFHPPHHRHVYGDGWINLSGKQSTITCE